MQRSSFFQSGFLSLSWLYRIVLALVVIGVILGIGQYRSNTTQSLDLANLKRQVDQLDQKSLSNTFTAADLVTLNNLASTIAVLSTEVSDLSSETQDQLADLAAQIASLEDQGTSARCSHGACLSLQVSNSPTQEVGSINLSGNALIGGTLTASTFAGDGSSLINLNASNIASGTLNADRLPTNIDTTKLGGGTVSNTELSYLNGVTSALQAQLNAMSANTTVIPNTNNFRLTLELGVPVPVTDQTAKTSVYLTPHSGKYLALYYSGTWVLVSSAEVSLALGTLTADKNYDVFAYTGDGTIITLELSAAWTDATTRADALTTQDGIRVKSGATNKRLVGTIRTVSTTETEDSAAKRFLLNEDNKVERPVRKVDTTDTWNHGSGATWTRWNASTANFVGFLSDGKRPVKAALRGSAAGGGAARDAAVGLHFDWSSGAPTYVSAYVQQDTARWNTMLAPVHAVATEGYHSVDMLQYGQTTAVFFSGDVGTTFAQSGLEGTVWN